jgi:hypothetical protein
VLKNDIVEAEALSDESGQPVRCLDPVAASGSGGRKSFVLPSAYDEVQDAAYDGNEETDADADALAGLDAGTIPAHTPAPTPVVVNGEVEWVVERITGMEYRNRRNRDGQKVKVPRYEVHWVGGDVTWEPFHVVMDCEALDMFEEQMRLEKQKP